MFVTNGLSKSRGDWPVPDWTGARVTDWITWPPLIYECFTQPLRRLGFTGIDFLNSLLRKIWKTLKGATVPKPKSCKILKVVDIGWMMPTQSNYIGFPLHIVGDPLHIVGHPTTYHMRLKSCQTMALMVSTVTKTPASLNIQTILNQTGISNMKQETRHNHF